MTAKICVRPGETIYQALAREGIDITQPITLPPGVSIHGPETRMTTFVVNRREES